MARMPFGILVVVFLLVFSPALWAQIELEGTVVDVAGDPLDGIDIDLFEGGTTDEIELSMDFTDADGAFLLETVDDIATGFYDIIFKAPRL